MTRNEVEKAVALGTMFLAAIGILIGGIGMAMVGYYLLASW